jgi:hypothetical protein
VVDIGNAYLNAEMVGHPVFMEIDPTLSKMIIDEYPEYGYYLENNKLVVRLKKALNGCVHSGKLWYDEITGFLTSLGYIINSVDKCVLTKTIYGKQCTILLYVDDILILCEREEEIKYVIESCRSKYKEITSSIGNDFCYLGLHVVLKDGKAIISMEGYISEILKLYNVEGSRATPATNDLFIDGEDIELIESEKDRFHSCVAKLLYLSIHMRYDLLTTISYLCTRVKCPNKSDDMKLMRALQYLNGTKERKLTLDAGDMKLRAWIDGAFGLHSDGKSHSGIVIALGNASISCKSSKQKIVSKDSTEAENVALSDKYNNLLLIHEELTDMGYNVGKPIIYQDNTSTIVLVTKGGGRQRTKHMTVRSNVVLEAYTNGLMDIIYTPTQDMIADVLTKPLQGVLFCKMINILMGNCT